MHERGPLTPLADKDMEWIYTFLTPYTTVDGKAKVYYKIGKIGNHFFESDTSRTKWLPAKNETWCKEIYKLWDYY